MRSRRNILISDSGGVITNPYPAGMTYVGQLLAPYQGTDVLVIPDGTQLYTSHGNGNLVRYSLTTPNKITSAVQKDDWGVAVLNTNKGIAYDDDGDRLFFAEASGQDTFYEKKFSVPYIYRPATYISQNTLFDISGSYTNTIQGFSIANGGKWIVFATANGTIGKGWFYYETSTPWDFSSVSFGGWIFQGLGFNPGKGAFSDDGLLFTCSDYQNSRMLQWDLSTPFDFNTRGTARIANITGNTPYGWCFGENGMSIYLQINGTLRIRQYNLNPAYIIPNTTI